jgi:hypothetical protein
LHETAKHEALMKEAARIVQDGKERGLHLRLLGAIAFQLHCPKYNYLTTRLHRTLTDVDLAGYNKERNEIEKMMREFGYVDEPMVTALFGRQRMIWDNKSTGMHVDIFFDKLEMNHDIPFEGRLERDNLTIPIADLMLEKMQIVKINEKDIIDTIMLLREHSVGSGDPERIDSAHLSRILANDWGFYHTVTMNLTVVQDRLDHYSELTEEDRRDVKSKIQSLLKTLENQPKTLAWKIRARVGTKTKWYKDVEEVSR